MAALLVARNVLRARAAATAASTSPLLQHLHLRGRIASAQPAVRALFSQQHDRDSTESPRSSSSVGRGRSRKAAEAPRRPRHPRTNSNSSTMDLHYQRKQTTSPTAKAQHWLAQQAAAGNYRAIVRSVADCYAPLYRTHAALAGRTCALVPLLATAPTGDSEDSDVVANDHHERSPSSRYHDGRTKMMEQLAIEQLFRAAQYELAVALYTHRQSVVVAIDETTGDKTNEKNEKNEKNGRMATHYRTFFSFAIGAFAALSDHAHVVRVYDAAVTAQLWPTGAMNTNYVRALTTLQHFDAAGRAFVAIPASDGYQNVFFYRTALFYASVSGDVRVAVDAKAAMDALQFALRPVDYAHCMRAYDALYLAKASKLTYSDVLARRDGYTSIDDGYTSIEDGYTSIDDDDSAETAASTVLALFDELVKSVRPSLTIPSDITRTVMPRALAAALLVDDPARVQSVLTLRGRSLVPLSDGALANAVTGLELAHAPHVAWRLVQDELELAQLKPRVLSAVIGSLLSFLCVQARLAAAVVGSEPTGMSDGHDDHHSVSLILAILDDLKRRNEPPAVISNALKRDLIVTLCADTTVVTSDSVLVPTLMVHNTLFRALDASFWCAFTVECCLVHNRLDAAKQLIQSRNVAAVPVLPLSLVLTVIESFVTKRDFAFVYQVATTAVNLTKCSSHDRLTVCCAAMRACRNVEWLDADDARAVFTAHLSHLDVHELPADIQVLLADESGQTTDG